MNHFLGSSRVTHRYASPSVRNDCAAMPLITFCFNASEFSRVTGVSLDNGPALPGHRKCEDRASTNSEAPAVQPKVRKTAMKTRRSLQ